MFGSRKHHRHGQQDGQRRFARSPGGAGDHPHDGEGRHGGRGHGRHGRGGGGRGRSGLGRFFAHGDLRLVVLHLIAETPRHGYDIIKEIEDRVAGAYSPSPGVIYPTLSLLEDQGFVTVDPEADGGKKLYRVTPQGEAFLVASRPALDAVLARIEAVGKGTAQGAHDRIGAAMERLKAALRRHLHGDAPDDATVTAMVAALDQAAETMESL